MKKNPMMSIWLSGAHAAAGKVLGPARGLMTAAARRHQKAMMRDAETMATAFWSSALQPPLKPRKRRKR